MLVRGAFNHLLRPGLRRDFRDSYQQYAEEYSTYLMTGQQDRAEVEAVAIAGLPRMPRRGEIEPVAFLDPEMSDKFVFVDDEFALGFGVSKKMMEDDIYGRANENAKWLGRSARLTQEYRAAELLDDAFTGATFTGLLGEALCANDHNFINASGTWSNVLATATQFGVTGLQAMFELAEQLNDHTGNPVPAQLNHVVLNIADEWAYIHITQSEGEPYTADRQTNALRRKQSNLSRTISHYKTQDRHWFGIDRNLNDAHFLFKVRPEFEDDYDFKAKASLYTARQRINVYFFDQRGWFGTNPT